MRSARAPAAAGSVWDHNHRGERVDTTTERLECEIRETHDGATVPTSLTLVELVNCAL